MLLFFFQAVKLRKTNNIPITANRLRLTAHGQPHTANRLSTWLTPVRQSGQRTAVSGQRTADSRERTADSGQP